MTDQKAKWAARADKRNTWADAAEAKAQAILSARSTDFAFISQPGHIPARAREIAATDRAFSLLSDAKAHRAKAVELNRMAATNKGDAEAKRQAERAATDFEAGQSVVSIHYGAAKVVKVNAKSVRIALPSGFVTTQDKSYLRAA